MKQRLLPPLTLLLLLLLSTGALWHIGKVLTHPYPLEYGEGINLLWSTRAEAGESLYPPVNPESFPQIHNPYPPVYPMVAATLNRLGLDTHAFLAGRFLSLFGWALAATVIFAFTRKECSPRIATGGALLFMLSPMMLRFGPMMRVDSLALGTSLLALWFLDHEKFKRSAVFAGLALCIKPSYLAAALAVGWIRLRKKRDLSLLFVIGCGALPGLMTLLFLQMTNPNWFQHLGTLQALPSDPGTLFTWLSRFCAQHAPVLVFGLLSIKTSSPTLRTYAVYIFVPLLLTASISGSQENYMMELWAVACVASARSWSDLQARSPTAAWMALCLQLLLFLPISPAPVFTRTYGQELAPNASSMGTPTQQDTEAGKLLFAELREVPGPILSADLGFLIPAGQLPLYQPYQFEKLTAAGKWSDALLQDSIGTKLFSHILLKGDVETAEDPTFRPEIQKVIDQNYELHRVLGPWHLYQRKSTSQMN